ncbi:MAG: hypothetical protein ACYTDT_03490 [Planctomycetota bacterium]|jgi:hypothetical protein
MTTVSHEVVIISFSSDDALYRFRFLRLLAITTGYRERPVQAFTMAVRVRSSGEMGEAMPVWSVLQSWPQYQPAGQEVVLGNGLAK